MPRQIGWSQESNLLYNISMQLDRLAAVTAAAGGGGGGTITGGGAAGQITFWDAATNITGSNNLFWDNVNKRMGIGTNTPLTTAAGYTVLALNGGVGAGGVVEFQSNGVRVATINNNQLQLDIETKIAGPITFGTNGSERMRVDSAGNVGIGTTTPAGKLDVTSDGGGQMFFSRYGGQPQINIRRAQGTFAVPTAVVNGASSVLNFQNYNGTAFQTSAQIQSVPTTQSATDAGATLALNVVQGLTTTMTNGLIVSGNNTTAGSISITNAFNGPSSRLTIWQSTLNTTLDYFDIIATGGAQLLRFWNSGNLTVGSGADATYRLDVNGTGRYQDNLLVQKSQNGTTSVSIQNFTAGTASVVEFKAQTDGSRIFTFGKYSTSTTSFKTINGGDGYIYNSSQGGDISILNDTTVGNIKFAAGGSNTAQMTLFSTGNLGIGSTTDVAGIKLNVNGNVLALTYSSSATYQTSLNLFSASNTFNPVGGSTTTNIFAVLNTINQQSGANGITRGIYVSPNLTNAFSWRSVETANNTGWAIYAGGTAPSLFNGDVSIAGKLALTVVANRQTVNYSLVLADNGKLVEMNVGAANTLTVPPNSSIAFPIGTKIDIAQYGAGQTSIVPGLGVTVRSALGALKLAAQYSGASLVKIGTDEWYLFGDITV